MIPEDADIYICRRVTHPPDALPRSTQGTCEICKHLIWVGPEVPLVGRRQCIECTSPEAMLAAGILEETREAIAAATGMTDDEITEKMHDMAKEMADRKRAQ